MDTKDKRIAFRRGYVLRVILFLLDAVVVNFAFFISIWIRLSDAESFRVSGLKYMAMYREFAPWYTIVCMGLFLLFRLYSGVWRYAGINDFKKLVVVNICTCVFYVCGSLLVVGRMPLSVYGLGACIQFALMAISRFAPRYIMDSMMSPKNGDENDIIVPMMIVGIGENSRIIQNQIARDRTNIVKPVCVVDYYYGFKGNTFNGLPVYSGPEAVKTCIEKFDIKCAIIADGTLPEDFLDEIRNTCDERQIELRDFIIGTDPSTRGVGIRELLKTTSGPVRLVFDGDEGHLFDTGEKALHSIKEKCTVESISADEGVLLIRISKGELKSSIINEEWIAKYREETGSDVSFF